MLEVDKKTFEDEVLKAEGYGIRRFHLVMDVFVPGSVASSYTKWQINTEIRSNSHL